MEDKAIQVYLLRPRPLITLHGQPVSFERDISQKLFFYLAGNGIDLYSREELSQLLFDQQENAREMFRKQALAIIPRTLKALCLDQTHHIDIRFFSDNVWVDSQTFSRQVEQLLQHGPLSKEHQRDAEATLALYEAPFLEPYAPVSASAFGLNNFSKWVRDYQLKLVNQKRALSDILIQSYLESAEDWPKAQAHAERWLHDEPAAILPLQYLIWLAVNRSQKSRLAEYLEQLEAHAQQGAHRVHPSTDQWNRWIEAGSTIPVTVFGLQEAQPRPGPSSVSGTPLIGRDEVLTNIHSLLTSLDGPRIFAVTGLPGVGKTELARTVATLLRGNDPAYRVIELNITQGLDLELLCNNVLDQLGLQEFMSLNYAAKRQRLKQALQAPNCLIIVDEGHTSHLADPKLVATILDVLSGPRLMLVARQVKHFDYYTIPIKAFDRTQTEAFLRRHVPRSDILDDSRLPELQALTGGLPLLLHIVVGFLNQERSRIPSLIQSLQPLQVQGISDTTVFTLYRTVLSWLWQYVGLQEKQLLYALSLFDPVEGASPDDLAAICTKVIRKNFRYQLKRLVEMRLVEMRPESDAQQYVLHPIMRDFIHEQAREARARLPYADVIERGYVDYFVQLITDHQSQFAYLDKRQRNVVHLLDFVLFSDAHTWAYPQVLVTLDAICAYLEKRGLFEAEGHLISRAIEITESQPIDKTRVQFLHRASQVAHKQAKTKLSKSFGEQALSAANAINFIQALGDIYLSLAIASMQAADYQSAAEYFSKAEESAATSGETLLVYRIWANSGVCAFHQSQFEKAKGYYEKVWQHLGENTQQLPEQFQDIAQFVLTALALTYTELEDFSKAQQLYQQSIALARTLNNPERLGYLYLNLGVTYYLLKDYRAAQDCFLQGLATAEKIQHQELITELTWNQGALASAQNRHTKAIRLLNSALVRAHENELHRLRGVILVALGKAYLKRHWLRKARLCFYEALNNTSTPNKYAVQAIYGLGLVSMIDLSAIGSDDIEVSYRHVTRVMTKLHRSLQQLPSISTDKLIKAQDYFQHDFDIPLKRYRVIEAVTLWLSQQNGEYSGE